MPKNLDILDTPVWSALTGPHSRFAIGGKNVLRYPREIAPFVAIDLSASSWVKELKNCLDEGEEVVLMGGHHDIELGPFECTKLTLADQMIYEEGLIQTDSFGLTELSGNHADEMVRLTTEVFPGYFRHNTFKMGRYYGIFSESRLVAMAGERLRPAATYQELSGICTLPFFQGKGYAAKLTSWAINEALKVNRQPFLHVNSENLTAIRLYERLGFKKRKTFTIRRLKRI